MDLKEKAAQKAATLVKNKAVIGLGAGSAMAFLVTFLEQAFYIGLEMKFVTSSFSTLQLLQDKRLPVYPIAAFAEIDIYFDGCDQLDYELNALKSGGGIHTQEKLLASMAKQFILVGDESKLVKAFDLKFPLVLEVLPQAVKFVPFKIQQLLDVAKQSIRVNDKKDGPVITENGNYLMDVYLNHWPELTRLNDGLNAVTGIVDTFLFYGIANKAIVAGEKEVVIFEKQCGA